MDKLVPLKKRNLDKLVNLKNNIKLWAEKCRGIQNIIDWEYIIHFRPVRDTVELSPSASFWQNFIASAW